MTEPKAIFSFSSPVHKYDVYISNTLQDLKQHYWIVKYRSSMTYVILRSNFESYWLIIRKYGICTWNTLQDLRLYYLTMKILQDIRQNHWTGKNRSCWLSLHDIQVNVTRLTAIWWGICLSCFHKRKVKKNTSYMCPRFCPTPGHGS